MLSNFRNEQDSPETSNNSSSIPLASCHGHGASKTRRQRLRKKMASAVPCIKKGINNKSCFHSSRTVQSVYTAPEKVATAKLKNIKIRLEPDGKQAKIVRGRGRPSLYVHTVKEKKLAKLSVDNSKNICDSSQKHNASAVCKTVASGHKLSVIPHSKSKRLGKQLAKQLLLKARKGHESFSKDGHVDVTAAPGYHRKRFILPTKSSRSSRVIKPNKRFLEDDGYQIMFSKSHIVDSHSLSWFSDNSYPAAEANLLPFEVDNQKWKEASGKDSGESSQKSAPSTDCSRSVINPTARRKSNQGQKHVQLISGNSGLHAEHSTKKTWRKNSRNLAVSTATKTIASSNLHLGKDVGKFGKDKTNSKGFIPFHYASTDQTAPLKSSESLNSDLSKKSRRRGGSSKMDSLPLAPTYSQLGLHSECTDAKRDCKSGILHTPLNETSLTGPALSEQDINESSSVRITGMLGSGLELRGLHTPGEKGYTSTESGKIGLYDMPLIVEGKRQRKPSLRMRLKQSEEIFGSRETKRVDLRKIEIEGEDEETKRNQDSDNFSQDDNDEKNNSFGNETSEMENKPSLPPIEQSLPTLPTSPFCPKLELFSPTGCGGSFVSPNEKQKMVEPVEKDVDATRRSGNNILRKAKFQLNWAALNRSKAALARSLRAKMRHEERLEKKKLRAQEQKLKQTSATSPLPLSSLSVLSRGLIDVHGSPKQTAVKMEGSAANPLSPGGSTVPFENVALSSVSQDEEDCSSVKEGALKRSRKMCAICGDKIGVFPFLGVPCCTGCRKFYTLNARRKKNPHSCKKSGNCSITRLTKSQCNACRLRRCKEIFPSDIDAVTLASSEKQLSDNDLVFSPAKRSSPSVKKGEGISSTAVSCEEADFVQLMSPKNKQNNRRSRRTKDISDEKYLKEEVIHSEDNVCNPSESSSTANDTSTCRTPTGNKSTTTKSGSVLKLRRRRKVRCKQCEGCLADDCGVCVYCLDKPKYGGKNVIKQACINRRCKFPRYTKFATNSFITPKKESSENKVDSDAQCNISSNSQRCHRRGAGSGGSGGGQLDSGTSPGYHPKLSKPNVKLKRQFLFQQLKKRTKEKAVTLYGKSTDSVNMYVQAPPMFSGAAGFLSSKNLEHIAMRKWTSQDYMYSPTAYRIKVDYKDDCDLCRVWEQGLAILVSTPLCVRTMCYLCGSAGQHEFVYCQLCCEPFHMFCLEEDWRPTDKNIDNWCCYRCHYCQVCGQQNNLLQCKKCHETYHPECLGPNYPTKPSKKKKIWICTKCVRCKSCGATTPGNSGNATWMHDFSLCYECGKLMDKGNYCPICRKCYTDDDWDSKMVQCSSCDSWVHSKCAGLTDELYMMFSHLPEDVQYICSLCSEKSPAQWECIIQETMQHGFQRVMLALQHSKCAQHLLGPMAAKQGIEKFKKKNKPKNCKVNTCGDDDHDSSQDDSAVTSLSLGLPHCKSDPSPCHNAPVFKVPHTSPRSKSSSVVGTKTVVGSPNTSPVFSSVSGCDKLIKSEAVTTYSSTNKVATSISSSQICDSSQTHSSDKLNNSICSYSTSRKCLLESFNKNSEVISNVTSPPNNSSLQTNSPKDSETKAIDSSVPKTTAVSLPKTGGACRFVMGPMSPAGFFRRNISNRSHGISITSTSKVPTTPVSSNTTVSAKSSSIANTLTTQSPSTNTNLNPSNSIQTSESCNVSGFSPKAISYGNNPKIPSVSTVCSSSSVSTVSALNGTIMTPNIVSCFSDTKAQSPHGSLVSSVTTCSFNNPNNNAPSGVVPKTTTLTDVSLSQPLTTETANDATRICTNITTSCTTSSTVGVSMVGSVNVLSSVSYGSSFISTVSSTASITGSATSKFPGTVPSSNTTSTTASITSCISSVIKSSDTTKSLPSPAVSTVIYKSPVFSSPTHSLNTHQDTNNIKNTKSSDKLFKNNLSTNQKNQKNKTTHETSKLNTIIEEDEEIDFNNSTKCSATPVSTAHSTSSSAKTPSTNSISTAQSSLQTTNCPSPVPSEDSTTDSASEDSDDVSNFNYKDVATSLQKERQKLFSEARKNKSLYTSDDGNLKCIPELALKAEKVKEYPKNFHDVIEKINKLHYQSVHQFNEDMVRIIQTALSDSADQTVSRKRANNSVRSIFIKHMEKFFPWFNVKACALWNHNKNLPVDMLPNAVLPPSGDHIYAQWMIRPFQPYSTHDFPLRKTCTTPHKKPGSFSLSHNNKDNESEEGSTAVEVCEDFRTCVLCWKTSDLDPEEEGRLVYVGQDDWIHVNCALWSAEAFEEESDGTLQNVQPAISRGKMMRCDKCTRPGATVGCCHRGCPANFHFLCAKQEYCIFQEDKKVFCYNHRHKVDGDLVEDNDFDVIRRVCIYMDHQKYPKKSWVKGLPASGINVIIGSCTVECLGNLTPLSDRYDMLLPVGFRSTRVYWSTKHANKRCVYTCRISLAKPQCPKKPNKEQQKLQSAEHNTTKIEDPELLENSKIEELAKSKTLTAESAEDCGRLGGITNDDESVVKATSNEKEKDLVPESNEQSNNISSDKPTDPKDSTDLVLKESSNVDSQVAVVENLEDDIVFTSEEDKLLFGDGAQDLETVVVVAEAEDMTDEEAIQLAREALLAADSNFTENEISTELTESDKGELDSMKAPKFDSVVEPEIVECSSEQPIVIPSCIDGDLPDNINSSLDAISEVQVHSECDKEMMYLEDDNKPVQVISFNRKTLPLNKKTQNRYSKVGSRFQDDKSTRFSPIYGPKGDIIGHKLSITDALALKNSLPSNSQNNLKDHSKRRLKRFCSKKNVKLLELDKSSGGILKHRKMVSNELTSLLHADKSRIPSNLDKVSCNKGVQDLTSSSESTWLNDTFDLGKNSGKSKNSPPVKVYPLRQTVSRMCEQALAKRPLEAISRSCRDDRAKSSLSVLSTVETTTEEQVVVKRSEDIPLHDKIALKIRAESLAKSSPGERGPFKCPTCKRLYRTKESFETHVEKCDFELSTSEEEDDDQDGLRSPRRYLGNPRYPMRNSTLIQRVAAEVEAEMNFGKKIHSRKRSHDSMSGLDSESLDSIQNKAKQSRSRKSGDLCGQIGNEQTQPTENREEQIVCSSSCGDSESKDLDLSNENSTSQTNLSIKEDKLTHSNCLPESSFADDSDATLSPAQCDHGLSLNEESCDKQNASVSSESAAGTQSTTDRNNLDLLSELASKLSKPPKEGNCHESDAKRLKVDEESGRLGKQKLEVLNGIISEASFLKQSVSRDRDSIPSEILPSSNSSESVKQHNTIITDDKTESSLGELFTDKCKELEDSSHKSLFYQIFHNASASNSTSKSLNVMDPLAKSKFVSKMSSDETQTDDNAHQELLNKNKPMFNNSISKSPIEFSTNLVKNINTFAEISHINNPAISLVGTSSKASLTSLTASLSTNVNSSHISELNSSSTQLIQCQDSMAPQMLTTPVVTMALCNTVCNVQPQTTCVVAPAQSVQPLTMSMQSASPHLLSLTSVNTPYFNTSDLTSPALPTLASPVFSQAAVTPIAIAPPLPSQPPPTPTLSINYVGSFVLPSATDQLVNITPPLSSNPFSSIATSVPQLQSTANINTSESISKIQSATTMHHAPNTMMLQEGSMQNKSPYIIHKTSVPTMQNSSSVVKILVDNNPPTSFVTGSSIDSNSSNTAYNYSKLLQEIFKVTQPPTITNQTSLIASTVSSKSDSCQTTSTSIVENPMASPSLSSLPSSNHKRSPNRKLYSRISRVKPSGLKAPFVFRQNCNKSQLADSADAVKIVSGVEESSKFIQNMVSLSSSSDLQVVSNVNKSVLPSQKEQFNLVSRKRQSAAGLQSTKRILSFISSKNGIVSDQQKEKEERAVAFDSNNNTEDKATKNAGNQTLTPATDSPNQTSDATDSKVFDPFTPKVTLRKKPVRKARNLNFRRRPRDLRKTTGREGNQQNGGAPFAEVEEEVMETPFMSSQTRNSTGPLPQPKPDLNLPHLVFEISSDDGFYCRAHSIDDAWRQVYEAVQDVRALSKRKQLSYANIDGALMFGVSHRAVVYLLEQLHGAKKCYNYKFNYHSPPREYDEDDQEPTETSSGCIRTEPFSTRKPYDMFSFLMSRYRNRPQSNHATGDEEMALKSSRRPTSMDLPMAMRFRHLQAHAREAVGVYRSMIHGRGLFCKRNIDAGEMVIEYAGEVIRAELTDKREKFYESKGIGCYMFRIDDVEVVDATMHGNAARFINHSCDPNCYSKVIQVDGKKHIVIFAMRPIKRGEELTYDYKFPIEDIKIACTCGSRRCRKYLN
eukprot:XP_014789912.1 PREDICTED: uncharacterized protein LOC106883428 isoform X2 [Octopus bimaculoides]